MCITSCYYLDSSERGRGYAEGVFPGRPHGVLLHYRCLLVFGSKYSGITINVNSIPCITCITWPTRVNGNLGTWGRGAWKDEEGAPDCTADHRFAPRARAKPPSQASLLLGILQESFSGLSTEPSSGQWGVAGLDHMPGDSCCAQPD